MTQFSLIANVKNNIDLHLVPIKGGDTITEATIHELIAESEYAKLQPNTANIKNAIAELNDVLKPLQENQTGREITYQVLERIDATITISIDPDEMGATAEITAAKGGKHLSAKAILEAAQSVGVKKGFSKEELVKLAQLAAKAESLSIVTLQIATGKLAINGKDAIVKPLVESAQSRILRPKKREDGSVDMRDLGDIVCVKVGDPLAKKIPLTSGEKGYTVTATPLIPEPGNDVSLISGDGTAISSKNENVLVSKKVGLPKIIPNGMEVDEIYKIKDVSVATGNVNFTGSVLIEGDVNEGMKVIASGDVTIGGFVFGLDAAVISGTLRYVAAEFMLDDMQLGNVVSAPALGVLLALVITGAVCESIGRKKTLILIAMLYVVSAIASALAPSYEALVAARFLGGLAFTSLSLASMYIGEIAPAKQRGKLVSMNQIMIVLNIKLIINI